MFIGSCIGGHTLSILHRGLVTGYIQGCKGQYERGLKQYAKQYSYGADEVRDKGNRVHSAKLMLQHGVAFHLWLYYINRRVPKSLVMLVL